MKSQQQMWIFGYGSLLWYQDFAYEKAISGVVKGFSRRFWQLSPDHRGTPESPGRTVTLIPDSKGICWGVAYMVPAEHVAATREYLDFREKAGYEVREVEFHPDSNEVEPFTVEVYMTHDNEGKVHTIPATVEEVADIILTSHGPSGPNIEYALRLADVLRKKAPHVPDEHVFALESRLLELSRKTGHGVEVLKKLGYDKLHD